ncbi:2'-5' RNA ligase family protein [Pradoshia sp.]
MMEQYFASRSSLAISFQSIGAFMKFPALFLSPVMTKELMQLHFDYYENFKRFSYAANGYYMPDSWVPHCTIISHVPTDRLSEAAALSMNMYNPFSGALTEVALVREGGPLLHSVTLQDPQML